VDILDPLPGWRKASGVRARGRPMGAIARFGARGAWAVRPLRRRPRVWGPSSLAADSSDRVGPGLGGRHARRGARWERFVGRPDASCTPPTGRRHGRLATLTPGERVLREVRTSLLAGAGRVDVRRKGPGGPGWRCRKGAGTRPGVARGRAGIQHDVYGSCPRTRTRQSLAPLLRWLGKRPAKCGNAKGDGSRSYEAFSSDRPRSRERPGVG